MPRSHALAPDTGVIGKPASVFRGSLSLMQPRFGQKRVQADSIQPGDVIFRSTRQGGDLMMQVHQVVWETQQDRSLIAYSGSVYALDPSSIGEDMIGNALAEDTWKIPSTGQVDKKVPIHEAEWRP
jgi:hypothetical protein